MHMLVEKGSDNTYRSTFASSSSSSVLSQVGCHIGISKYLTRKGQTTLSKAKNKKYLPQRNSRGKQHDECKQPIQCSHPRTGVDAFTQNFRVPFCAKKLTGGPYCGWVSMLPSRRRKLATPSCKLPS